MSIRRLRAGLEFRVARTLLGLPSPVQLALSGRLPRRHGGQRLEAEMQLMLSLLEALGRRELGESDPRESRAEARRQAMTHAGPKIAVAATRDFAIPGPAGLIAVRHYAPREPGGPHPLLVYFHGGGFVIGDLDTHDMPCRLLCRDAGVHVLAVDYRLAPEHPFPAAVDDARAAFRWACEHASELGADPRRVAVGGDSAGGNLAAVVSQLSARDAQREPALQLLVYPSTDRVHPFPSQGLFGEGFYLSSRDIDWYYEQYTGGTGVPRDDPAISPLCAKPFPKLCPAIVVTAGCDPLRDEGDAYARALAAAGTRTEHVCAPGLLHGFLNMSAVSPASARATGEITRRLRVLFGSLAGGLAATLG
jgi:acetyl esterase